MIRGRLPAALAALIVSFSLVSCSLPRIIILHDPLSAEEHLRLGSIYEAQGKMDLALRQYREAVRDDRRYLPAWLRLGDLSARLGRFRDAEKAYAKALDLDPKSGDIHNNLAWSLLQQSRKLGRAESLVRQALDLNPSNRPYYLDTLGMVLLRLGRTAEAIEALEEAVRAMPKEQRPFLAEAYSHLAQAYRATGDRERADAAEAAAAALSAP